MKRKIAWLVTSCLMVVALVLAACGPAAPTTPTTPTPTPTTPTPMTPTPTPTVEAPKYGGVFIMALSSDVTGFDEAFTRWPYTVRLTNEELAIGDWARGPTGSNEASFSHYAYLGPPIEAPCLAESWELTDSQTIIFNIRKGVHWHDKPPVNGRELVADDVVFSAKRLWEIPGAYIGVSFPKPESITARDKYTVVVKAAPGKTPTVFEVFMEQMGIMPPEAGGKYPGSFADWRVSCGTGPFMLVDYVPMASTTFKRNPNYWGKDPLHPDNSLPYLDGVKWITIPDLSSRQAALRTGKIDLLTALTWEDMKSLMTTNPEFKWSEFLTTSPYAIFMREDKPELPFDDIRVRKALNLAIDKQKITDTFYLGKAEVFSYPITPLPEYMWAYIPPKELPESVRELFEYHPEKARTLLAEAGYPNGFKTKVVCLSSHVDLLSIVKASWADIGVNLDLDVKEPAVWMAMQMRKTHEEMVFKYIGQGHPLSTFLECYGNSKHAENANMVDDNVIMEAFSFMMQNYFDEPLKQKRFRELVPYILEQAWWVWLPNPYYYTVWQPWVKGYSGETSVGGYNLQNFPIWIWVDQELKEKMTGRR